MGICLPVLMWATFLGIISTNEALPHKLVRVTRFDFDLPPKKGEVFARLSKVRPLATQPLSYTDLADAQFLIGSKTT